MKVTTSTGTDPIRVLFVCRANMARSPFAALLARHRSRDSRLEFDSCGVSAPRGVRMEPAMVAQLQRRGVQASHASKSVSSALLRRASLVLTMEPGQRQSLIRDFPTQAQEIFTFGQYLAAFRDVSASSMTDLTTLPSRRPPADSSPVVPDPVITDARSVESVARQLDEMVDRLLKILGWQSAVG